MNKYMLTALFAAAFLAGDKIAVRRANKVIAANSKVHAKECSREFHEGYRAGANFIRTDASSIREAYARLFDVYKPDTN